MASERKTSDILAALNARLSEARDNLLNDGEEVLAEERGDQGQAIILTTSRVIVLKVGLAATGEVNGQRLNAVERSSVREVVLRKGPMGAAIQICADRTGEHASAQPSDFLVVFGDPAREKKCEAMAARIASELGIELKRVEPGTADQKHADLAQTPVDTEVAVVAPDPTPQGEGAPPDIPETPARRQPVSLADEIFAEVSGQSGASAEGPVPAAVGTSAPESAEAVNEPNGTGFGPNPRLPKPVRVRRSNSLRALLAVAVLAGLVIAAMAVMAPAPEPSVSPSVEDQIELTLDPDLIRSQLQDVDDYRRAVIAILQSCDADIEAFKAAVSSGDAGALEKIRSERTYEAWRTLSGLEAPPGLVGARSKLSSGLFALKTAIADSLNRLQEGRGLDAQSVAQKVAEAEKTIRSGLTEIDSVRSELERRLEQTTTRRPGS